MRAFTRYAHAAGTAAVMELAWHLLGPAWAFGVLTAALVWLAGKLPAAMAASAKAYAVEARVNDLVPVIASAHTTANSAQSTANSANSTANTANNRVGNLSGSNTTTNGLANGQINGSINSASLPDGTINGNSSTAGLPNGQIGGYCAWHNAQSSGVIPAGVTTQHTHDYSHNHEAGDQSVINGQHSHGSGDYAVANGNHSHGTSGLAVANGQHSHDLPSV